MNITVVAGAEPNFMKIASIIKAINKLYSGQWKQGEIPKLWDEKAAQSIVHYLIEICKL